jgi:hypothetical protein
MPSQCRLEIEWTRLEEPRDALWGANFCLYSYLHPETDRILYIGKADYQTVRQRLHGEHKSELFEFFWRAFRLDDVDVIQGDLLPEEGRRRSTQLLTHVESLLIMRLQPPGNVAYTRSRPYRPGLRIKCTGAWPHRRTGFHDWD